MHMNQAKSINHVSMKMKNKPARDHSKTAEMLFLVSQEPCNCIPLDEHESIKAIIATTRMAERIMNSIFKMKLEILALCNARCTLIPMRLNKAHRIAPHTKINVNIQCILS